MVEAAVTETSQGQFANIGAIPDTVINEEVKEFEPELEDIFFIITSGDYQRILFYD